MRNVAAIKNVLDQRQLSAIILAAGRGRRMNSYGSKSLIKVKDTNLINYQIQTIREKFPQIGEIICVLGYEAEKIYRSLPENVKVVENESFADNNTIRSIGIGLRVCLSNYVLLVHGDVFFDIHSLNFNMDSAINIDKASRMNDDKVGITAENGNLVHCGYGLETKWGQVAFLAGKELSLLRKMSNDRNKDNLCTFEALNYITNNGGNIKCVELNPKAQLFEFNSILDVEIFNGQT